MKLLLYPYSWISRGVSRVRDRLYRAGIFADKRCGLKVFSVGNISLGGTGKTPLVIELIKTLQAEGLKTAMVTRGYKSSWEKRGGMLTDGDKYFGGWMEAGDEPFRVARNVPGAGVFVGRNRLRSCRLAKVKGFAIAVLDDGFQHRRLHRDLDIVLYDPKEKILREPLSALSRAGIVLLPEEDAARSRETLGPRFSQASFYAFAAVPKAVFRAGVKGGPAPLTDLKSLPVLAFCGIAKPKRFFDLLGQQGIEPAASLTFPDHHSYPQTTMEKIAKKCDQVGAKAALTTEKDAVKLAARLDFLKDRPLYYLKIGLRIEQGFFDQVRKALRDKERPRR